MSDSRVKVNLIALYRSHKTTQENVDNFGKTRLKIRFVV